MAIQLVKPRIINHFLKPVYSEPYITSSNLFKVLTVFFAVVVGAFGISQAGQNAEFFATAQAAAYSIYEVIDRVPPIDTASQGSMKSLELSTINYYDILDILGAKAFDPCFK